MELGTELVIYGLLIVAAYFIGAIPTGYLAVRRLGQKDIREVGSRNVGTLNTWYQVGLAGAVPVLVVDAAKGAITVLVPVWLGAPEWVIYCTATAGIVGHNWPVYLKFRGGKGVAPLLGIALALFFASTLVAMAPGVLAIILSRNVIIGIAVGMVVLNVINPIRGADRELTILVAGLTALVVGSYCWSIRRQIWEAVKSGRLMEVFYGPRLMP